MKTTIKAAFAITILSLFTPCSLLCAEETTKVGQTGKEEKEQLQGRWEGFERGREGEGKCMMTISGDSIAFQGANKNEWYKAIFTLPSGTRPSQLNATIKECSAPDFVGKSSLAIYKLEEGTLTVVGHMPGAPDAPKTFEGDQGSRAFIFKKAEPQKDGAASSK